MICNDSANLFWAIKGLQQDLYWGFPGAAGGNTVLYAADTALEIAPVSSSTADCFEIGLRSRARAPIAFTTALPTCGSSVPNGK